MSKPLFIPLKVGETYTIHDCYGMVAYRAVYRGFMHDENLVDADHLDMLLFQRAPKGSNNMGSEWAGVTPRVEVHDSKGLTINLVADHYGETPEGLKPCVGDIERPNWVFQREKP